MRKLILLLLFVPIFSFGQHIAHSGGPDSRISGLMGYAMVSGSTTGGAGGAISYVNTLDALKTALSNPSAAIVYVLGTIVGNGDDAVYFTSNKSLIGTPGAILSGISLRAFTVSNIIIQNLTMYASQVDNGIIIKDSSHHIWIDHCDFTADRNHDWDYYGKAIAISNSSDYATVSWCRFHDANLSVLIGADPADATTSYLHVTFHHNFWYNCSEREPSNWSANIHMFNNYHLANTGYSVGSRASCNIRMDNEYFEGCNKPVTTNFPGDPSGYVSGVSTSIFDKSGSNDITTTDNNFLPSYSYSAYLDQAANVPALVKAGAGVIRSALPQDYMVPDELMGAIKELGGSVKAITAGVSFSSFTANRALVDGRFEIVPIYIRQATTLTGVKTMLQTAGSYTGDQFNGIMFYQQHLGSLTLLGYSAGTSTTWTATANTVLTLPFTIPVAVQPGLYYVAILYNNSAQTTAPKIYTSVDYNQSLWSMFSLTNSNILYGVKTGVAVPPSPQAASGISSTSDSIPFIAVY